MISWNEFKSIYSCLRTIDDVLCCIPVVSTVANAVHLLALMVMKVLEKYFDVIPRRSFLFTYKIFLEVRSVHEYVISSIPVLGNCIYVAVLLFLPDPTNVTAQRG